MAAPRVASPLIINTSERGLERRGHTASGTTAGARPHIRMTSTPHMAVMCTVMFALATTSALPPVEPHGSLDPTRGVSTSATSRSIPIIIDTDANMDDFLAIVFALRHPRLDVRAITVASTGFSNQFSGVQNVMKLTQLCGQPEIPVAFGPAGGATKLNGQYPKSIVPAKWLASDTFLQEPWVPLRPNVRPPSSMNAANLIISTLKETDGKVDIVMLSPLTNLDAALQLDRETFLSKVGTLFYSGGTYPMPATNVREEIGKSGQQAYPWSAAKAGTRCWNTFCDPIAAERVFASGVDVEMMLARTEATLPVYVEDVTKSIPSSCLASVESNTSQQLLLQWAPTQNATFPKPPLLGDYSYWDPSAMVAFAQRVLEASGVASTSQPVCTRKSLASVQVNLVNGPDYAYMVTDAGSSRRVTMCTAAKLNAFLREFWSIVACPQLSGPPDAAPAGL